ncbi:MAG TPA: hypothetical protein VMR34_05125 [Candidatus Saccharimonadales bacterium]|nr:hypothetical protein [Candidatus Saccharimonadales bacterium]
MFIRYHRKNRRFSASSAKRKLYGLVILFLLSAIALPVLFNGNAFASYALVTYRTIGISTSLEGNTTTTYSVSFRPATPADPVDGIVIDFCSNDPIIGDTCSNSSGNVPNMGASPTVSVPGGITHTTDAWVPATSGTNDSTLTLTNSYVGGPGGQTETGGTTPITFTISNVTNPTTIGTFYGRIYTFDTAGHANSYSATGANTGLIDAGGVAMAIVQVITVQSKVQEQLFFCMYISSTAGMDSSDSYECGGGVSGSEVCLGSGEAVTAGLTTCGTQKDTLSTANNYVDNSTKFDLTSNAVHGVTMWVYGTPLETSGSTCTSSTTGCIESSVNSGTGSTAGTAYTVSTYAVTQFGFCANQDGGSGFTLIAPYNGCSTYTTTTEGSNGDGGATFGFDVSNSSTGVSEVLSTSTGNANGGQIAFAANISPTTPAGIYTTGLTFIANATY